MDINQFLNNLNLVNFLSLGIKILAVGISIFYLLFSIVILKQVGVMKKTIEFNDYGLLSFFSFIQLSLGIFLLFYSLFVL